MITRTYKIDNKSGLHVRPASVLANGIGKFDSDIMILFGGNEYNAKSVINVLAACIKKGDTIEIVAEGPDETEAMDEVASLIAGGLGEG